MKLRDVINFIGIIILTIFSIVLICSISLVVTLNSNGIMKAVEKTGYLDSCEAEMKKILLNYLPEDKVDNVLEEVNVKGDIIGVINAFDSNKIEANATDMRKNVEEEVLQVLDDNTSEETKKEFANVVANVYMSEIFPVTEFDMISTYYQHYVQYIIMAIVIVGIICAIMCIYFISSRKGKNCFIVSLYNIIILSLMLVLMFGILDNLVIGDEITTSIILNLISGIKDIIVFCIVLISVVVLILNYFIYFKKRKKVN